MGLGADAPGRLVAAVPRRPDQRVHTGSSCPTDRSRPRAAPVFPRSRCSCSVDKDVECDELAWCLISTQVWGKIAAILFRSATGGRRYVPQKYSYIENNWVDGGNPLRVVADRSIVVEATYVSKTRLTCKAPSFDFPTHEEVAHKFRTSCLFDRFRPGPWPLKPPLDIDGNECRGPVESWHPTCKADYPAGNPTDGSRTSASGTVNG